MTGAFAHGVGVMQICPPGWKEWVTDFWWGLRHIWRELHQKFPGRHRSFGVAESAIDLPAMSSAPPRKPSPLDYGLSERDVIWISRLSNIGLIWLLGLPFLWGVASEVPAAGLLVLFWVFPPLIPALISFLLPMFHPAYPKWKIYRKAMNAYSSWLENEKRRRLSWWFYQTGDSLETEVANLYCALGYRVDQKGGPGDEGVDLFASKNELIVVVQCKAHRKPVGPAAVRDLYGALLHHKADLAALVSPRGFTAGAKSFARGKPIELLDADKLVELAGRHNLG